MDPVDLELVLKVMQASGATYVKATKGDLTVEAEFPPQERAGVRETNVQAQTWEQFKRPRFPTGNEMP